MRLKGASNPSVDTNGWVTVGVRLCLARLCRLVFWWRPETPKSRTPRARGYLALYATRRHVDTCRLSRSLVASHWTDRTLDRQNIEHRPPPQVSAPTHGPDPYFPLQRLQLHFPRTRCNTSKPSQTTTRVAKHFARACPFKMRWQLGQRATHALSARQRSETRRLGFVPALLRISDGFGPEPYAPLINPP